MKGQDHRIVLAVATSAAALVLCFQPDAAWADAAQARIHFDKGRTYFQVDEYRKAIEEFKAAHIEKADPAFLYNIAECYRHLGETREALTFYRRFLSLAPPNDRSRPAVERRIAELQAAADETKAAPADSLASSHAGPGAVPVSSPPPAPPAEAPAVALVAQPSPAPVDESRPLYTKGWFIAVVGVVLVGGAVGIWALTRGGGTDVPSTPLGNQGAF